MFNKHLLSRNIKSCYLKLGISSPSPFGSDTKWYNRQLCLCCGCEMSKQISEVTRSQKYVPKVSAGYLASVCNMFFLGGCHTRKVGELYNIQTWPNLRIVLGLQPEPIATWPRKCQPLLLRKEQGPAETVHTMVAKRSESEDMGKLYTNI
jgi:hypothetical protein